MSSGPILPLSVFYPSGLAKKSGGLSLHAGGRQMLIVPRNPNKNPKIFI